MKRSKRWLGLLVVLGVAIIAGGGLLVATAADDDAGDREQAITGEALERASAAALAYTGGGRVTDTEAGDEEGAYEVEVTLDDGRQVDVHLDEDFSVIGSEDDGADEDDD